MQTFSTTQRHASDFSPAPNTIFANRHNPPFSFLIYFSLSPSARRNQTKQDSEKRLNYQCIPQSSPRSLIPSSIYSSSPSSYSPLSMGRFSSLDALHQSPPVPSQASSSNLNSFVIPAPNEKIQMYSPDFFAACTAGGMLSCGLTHMAVTPLDLVKCNMQLVIHLIFFNLQHCSVLF